MKLNEEKSISNDVKEITDYIISSMLQDAKNVKIRINDDKIAYRENTIRIEFDDIPPIFLSYCIYYANKIHSAHDISLLLSRSGKNLNCSYDNVSRVLEVVGISENGYLERDFYGDVLHEVTHMFQYDQGMEKRADLYKSVIKMIQGKNSSRDERYAAVCLYYTFAHEQDAFTHQFYGLLKEFPNDIKIPFDEALGKFNHYNSFKTIRKYIKQHHKNQSMQRAFRMLGFETKSFLKRMEFGWQRFKRKLSNAYFMYSKEFNESKNNYIFNPEDILNEFKLRELYGDNTEFINESRVKKITMNYDDFIDVITESVKRYLLIKD